MKQLKIGLIGHKFMGKAHTHAYTDVPIFFDTGMEIVKKTLCANEPDVVDVAKQWGWQSATLNWQDVVSDPEIDAIDISAPSALHAEIAIAAAQNGKHVFCEKPLALSLADAEAMTDAVKKAGVVNMIGFSFRRVPALALAQKMIASGQLGDIFHFRGAFLQDWLIDPGFPLAWRLQKKDAGYGSLGDLGAHVVDQARFLVGEIEEVMCDARTFVTQRPIPLSSSGLSGVAGTEMGTVDVDDAVSMLLRFKGKPTMGYIEATRNATGRKNQHTIEINGSKGAIVFDMERMNELKYYNAEDADGQQGFRTIIVTDPAQPYMAAWWPAGHIIGYGESLVNQAYDFVMAIKEGKQVRANFEDGLICQKVLDAAQRSSETRQWTAAD